MNQQDNSLSDASKSETISYYLREGRRLQSNEVWNLIHMIGRKLNLKLQQNEPVH